MTITIKKFVTYALASLTVIAAIPTQAEILAMVNYESKPHQVHRREGIAIIDVDPESPNFAKIINDIPLPADLVAHHIFYNKDTSKAYITALGSNPLQVIDLKKYPYRLKTVPVPACKVSEDMVFSADGKTWYLTCMGSSNVIKADAHTDQVTQVIAAAETADAKTPFISHPHGIGLDDRIQRLIVTSTVRPADLGQPGETVTVIEAGSGKILSTHKLSELASPSGVAPVEAVFLPKAQPPRAYINTMFGGNLWTGVWNVSSQQFDFKKIYDFAPLKQGVPLEIYFSDELDRMYITTANPGHLNIFDLKDPEKPLLIKSIRTAGGAHHVVFSPDERYALVQNSFLNLPDMNDGSISVIDLQQLAIKTRIDTFKKQGLNPNCIILLPEWHHDNAH
jgi:DNA-binding beta-propeller fold protein YncE